MQRFEIDGTPFHAIRELNSNVNISLLEGYISSFPTSSTIPVFTLMFNGITYKEYIALTTKAISGAKKIKGPDDVNYMVIANRLSYSETSKNRYNIDITFQKVEGIIVTSKAIYIENDWEYIIDESFENAEWTGSDITTVDGIGRTGGKQQSSITWEKETGTVKSVADAEAYEGGDVLKTDGGRVTINAYARDVQIEGMFNWHLEPNIITIDLLKDGNFDNGNLATDWDDYDSLHPSLPPAATTGAFFRQAGAWGCKITPYQSPTYYEGYIEQNVMIPVDNITAFTGYSKLFSTRTVTMKVTYTDDTTDQYTRTSSSGTWVLDNYLSTLAAGKIIKTIRWTHSPNRGSDSAIDSLSMTTSGISENEEIDLGPLDPADYAIIRWHTPIDGDGYSDSIELYMDRISNIIYLAYREGTTQKIITPQKPIPMDIDTWYSFKIINIGHNVNVWINGTHIFSVQLEKAVAAGINTTGGISFESNGAATKTMWWDTIQVSTPKRSVISLPPGSEPIGSYSNIHTLETPYGKIYRSIGREKQLIGRWEETGPDCILYTDFRDKNASHPKNYAFNLDSSVTNDGFDLISNGSIIENGGISGNALRLDSNLSVPATASPEKTKFIIFPYQFGFNTNGKATVRIRMKFHEFSTGEEPMVIYAHRTSSHKEAIELQMIYERTSVQEFAGTSKIYRVKIIQWSEGSTGTAHYMDLELEKYYDFVFIWDYDNNYKMTYLDGQPISKDYDITDAPAAITLYSIIGGNTSTDTSIYPTGNYRINATVDLIAIYRTVIHPIKGQGLISAENVRAYRIPNSSILDWWRDSANVIDQLEVGWTQRWTGKTSQYEFAAFNDFPEVAALSTGTLHGGGIWSQTDMPDLAFYNSFILNGLDSRIRIADRQFYKETWHGAPTTFVIWFKHDSAEITDGYLWSIPYNSNTEYGIFFLWDDSINALNVRILQTISSSETEDMLIYINSNDDTWHQYIVVVSANYCQLYRDGRLIRDQFLTWSDWDIVNAHNISYHSVGSVYPFEAPWAGIATHILEGNIHGWFWINKAITPAEAKLLYQTYPRKAWYIPESRQTWQGHQYLLKENNEDFAKETNVLGMWTFHDGTPDHQLTYIHDTSANVVYLQRYNSVTPLTNNVPDANGPQWNPDTPSKHWDYSLSFNGTNQQLYRTGLSGVEYGFPGGSDQRTYNFILKTGDTTDEATIFNSGSTTEFIQINYGSDTDTGLEIELRDGGVPNIYTGKKFNIFDDVWHLLTITVNRSTNTMVIYVDGKFDSSTTIAGFPSTSAEIAIGNWRNSTNWIAMKMVHFSIYSYAWSASDVRETYKNWFGPTIQLERTVQRLYRARDWRWHQKKNVNVLGSPNDTLWIENGLIGLRISKQSKFDAGHISQFVWDPSVDNWDYIGNIGVYAETVESTGDNDQYVRSFDIVEITGNSVIIDCQMMNNWELDPIIQTTDVRSWKENDIIIRVELFGGQQTVVFSIVSTPMNEETFSTTSFQWLIHFMEGAYYHFTVLGGISASTDVFGRTASTSRDEPDHAWMPASAFVRHGRKWVGFAAGNKYSSATDRWYFATVSGVARQMSMRSLDVDERFIVGAVPTPFYPLVYPRDNSEPGVTYVGGAAAEIANSITATTTPDGYITELNSGTDTVNVDWGTVDAGHYWMGGRFHGGGATGSLRLRDGTSDIYVNSSTGEVVVMIDQYYDQTSNLNTHFTASATNVEIDYAICIPMSGQKDYQGIMDTIYLAMIKCKNTVGGKIGAKIT
ncbi:hypothetical protein LCGC14_0267100 [marine sediment metagenome]|uniref:Uncharacterized protein n=1 Tax=marine sediment metagenome TaxID=412755 RepID=A0A0F9U4K8_9ZZZZ